MAGQKFQYDESGATFYYFVLSFLAMLLLPVTYYWWPRKKEGGTDDEKNCNCPPCNAKNLILSTSLSWDSRKQTLKKCLIVSGWLLLCFLTYRVQQFEYEMASFDPYEILNIPLSASVTDIKKSYKKLSLIYHPDKETGDEKTFMRLTKAYQALTNEEAKRNLEKYGNPDGPGAMSFGIALPSWIVEEKNAKWVLGAYALVFMILLPTVVGIWWYSSIQYSGDKVLLDTTQLYYYMFHKTPTMPLKRALMVLAASAEFDKRCNKEVVVRPTDDVEVPQLMRQLPQLNENNKEQPLCREYSVKARALLHAHLSRLLLNPETLEKDRQQVVNKCPALIQEMVSCTAQLVQMAYARRIPASKFVHIDTIENVMKMSPMIVQGLWEFKSPLLQLPYITEDHLKYFVLKKRPIKTIQQFAQLKAEERRAMLRSLSDAQFSDVMKVVASMPFIECTVDSQVIDDEQTKVYTAGAMVTVTITLKRKDMGTLLGDETVKEKAIEDAEVEEENVGDEKKEEKEPKVVKPVWQKNKKQKTSKKKKVQNKTSSKHEHKVEVKPETDKPEPTMNGSVKAIKSTSHDDSDTGADSDSDDDKSGDDDDDTKSDSLKNADDDDDNWDKIRNAKNPRILNSKGKISHTVHCPYYPGVKQEYWWVYICDRKSKSLLSVPYHVTDLVETKTVEQMFTAPNWPGVYTFTVCLRSDSYLGASQMHDLKLDVKEAPQHVTDHPQWDNVSDTEEKKSDHSDFSEYTTDEDVEDD